jgi:hypothetical protein
VKDAGFSTGEFTILVQDYPSPIPETAGKFRFPQNVRRSECGAPFQNADAEWASSTAQVVIDKTVKEAAENVKAATAYQVNFMELKNAFNGRRLCEEGLSLVGQGTPPTPADWKSVNAVDESEWINQIRIKPGNPFSQNEGFHPNYWGQLALRNCLRKMYNNGAPLTNKECIIEAPGLETSLAGKFDWLLEPRMKLK